MISRTSVNKAHSPQRRIDHRENRERRRNGKGEEIRTLALSSSLCVFSAVNELIDIETISEYSKSDAMRQFRWDGAGIITIDEGTSTTWPPS